MPGAAVAREASGATAAVFFGSDPSLPLSLVAMEERWAFVNLARLSADGPDGAALAMRSRKMLMRNLLLLLGAAGSKYPANPVKPVATIKDLDSLPEPLLTIDSLMGMNSYLPGLGIERYETMTYQEACEEGVAPPPTNDVQRAIWSKYNKK